MRITEAQARRMGLRIPQAEPKGKAEGPAKPMSKGRDRAPRAPQPGEPVSFCVALPYDPKPKERPRTVASKDALKAAFLSARGSLEAFMKAIEGRISHTYTPKATADYEALVKASAAAAMAGRAPFSCAVETRVTLVLKGDPGTWPTSRLDGDADNLEKAVLDAMNGIVFADDRLVVRSWREKECGEEPSLRVEVRPAAA